MNQSLKKTGQSGFFIKVSYKDWAVLLCRCLLFMFWNWPFRNFDSLCCVCTSRVAFWILRYYSHFIRYLFITKRLINNVRWVMCWNETGTRPCHVCKHHSLLHTPHIYHWGRWLLLLSLTATLSQIAALINDPHQMLFLDWMVNI